MEQQLAERVEHGAAPASEKKRSPRSQRRLDRKAAKRAQKEHEKELRRAARTKGAIVRRLVALAIIAAMTFGIYWAIFHSGVADPVLEAYAEPVKGAIDWVTADPARAWVALAAIITPHIGLYYMIFEDR